MLSEVSTMVLVSKVSNLVMVFPAKAPVMSTGVGNREELVVPFPSWPYPLNPHA